MYCASQYSVSFTTRGAYFKSIKLNPTEPS